MSTKKEAAILWLLLFGGLAVPVLGALIISWLMIFNAFNPWHGVPMVMALVVVALAALWFIFGCPSITNITRDNGRGILWWMGAIATTAVVIGLSWWALSTPWWNTAPVQSDPYSVVSWTTGPIWWKWVLVSMVMMIIALVVAGLVNAELIQVQNERTEQEAAYENPRQIKRNWWKDFFAPTLFFWNGMKLVAKAFYLLALLGVVCLLTLANIAYVGENASVAVALEQLLHILGL